jgi:hypothetical protein
MNKSKFAAVMPILVLVSLACLCSSESLATEEPDAPAVSGGEEEGIEEPVSEQPTPVPPTPTEVLGRIEVGTYIVGEDIAPGIYRGETGPDFLDSCYWERLSDLSGELDAILANDNSVGQYYIEIKSTDEAFHTDCPLVALENVPEPADNNPQILSPGMYLIGRDIQPGRYRGEAGADFLESCYWERLSDVSGDFTAIIANDNATGQYFAQVAETDFALSTDCTLELVP